MRTRPWACLARAALTAALAGAGASRAQAPTLPATPQRIEAIVRDEMQRERVPGVAVAVMRGGKVLLAKGDGWVNVEDDVPVNLPTMGGRPVSALVDSSKTRGATSWMVEWRRRRL